MGHCQWQCPPRLTPGPRERTGQWVLRGALVSQEAPANAAWHVRSRGPRSSPRLLAESGFLASGRPAGQSRRHMHPRFLNPAGGGFAGRANPYPTSSRRPGPGAVSSPPSDIRPLLEPCEGRHGKAGGPAPQALVRREVRGQNVHVESWISKAPFKLKLPQLSPKPAAKTCNCKRFASKFDTRALHHRSAGF